MTSGLGSEWIARKLIAVATLPSHLLSQASRDLLCGMGSSAPRHVATWMEEHLKGGGYTCVWLRHFAVHLELAQHC